MKTSIFIGLIFLLLSPMANAWLLFEPGIGYNRGHYQTNKAQGIGLGLKLGFETSSFFIAGDAGYHDVQLGAIPQATLTDTGLTIGVNLRSWRVWYTNIFSSLLTYPSGADTISVTGAGSKLGLGVFVSGKVSLNFEFRFIDYKESSSAVAGTTTPVAEFLDAAFISISIPL